MKRKRTTCAALAAIPLLIAASMDQASAATYQLSETYGVGNVAPAAAPPWLILTTTTLSGPDEGKVQLEFYASGLTASEYVSEWYLNFDPALDVKDLDFGTGVKFGSFSLPTISLKNDFYKAGSDGRFDIKLEFSTSGAGGGVNRFTDEDRLTYIVSYKGGPLTADSFDFFSKPEGGFGPYHTAAHVLATGDGSGSAWISSVPEPGPPLQALILAGSLLTFYRRRG